MDIVIVWLLGLLQVSVAVAVIVRGPSLRSVRVTLQNSVPEAVSPLTQTFSTAPISSLAVPLTTTVVVLIHSPLMGESIATEGDSKSMVMLTTAGME